MSELMSQLITPELMTAFTVFIVLLVVLYLLHTNKIANYLTLYLHRNITLLYLQLHF